MKQKVLTAGALILLCISNFGVKPSIASDELFEICSKFPDNSRCAEYKIPIPLDHYQGVQARCRYEETQKMMACKVLWSSSGLVIYSETGEKLKSLKGKREAEKNIIPLDLIDSLTYSKSSKIDYRYVGAFGLLGGLLAPKIKLSSITVQYQEPSPVSKDEESSLYSEKKSNDINLTIKDEESDGDKIKNPLESVDDESLDDANMIDREKIEIVINRKSGKNMIQYLEFKTNIKATTIK